MVERALLRRNCWTLLFLAVLSTLPGAVLAQVPGPLLTRAERTDFRETSRYDEVVRFVANVVEGRPDMHLTTMGYTFEGRPIPLVVVGRVADGSPEAVRASGKTRVYLQGGIHAGEIAGKEALLILLRDLSQGRHSSWADSLVILVAPLYNADGNERVSVLNRPRQHGPVGGMGQRTNAQDLDLNRDHLKLDAPESRSVAKMFVDYDPHVAVDLHTTNGTRHGYHLTYAPPLHPATPRAIDLLLRDRLLPAITRAVKEKHGWDMYHYGNAMQARGGMEAGWYTFDHRARFSNNYAGLRNRFGILGEAYSYATFRERTEVSLWFVEEILHFSHAHATEMARTAAEADRLSLVGESWAVRSSFRRSAEPATILMGETEEELNPLLRQDDAPQNRGPGAPGDGRVRELPGHGVRERSSGLLPSAKPDGSPAAPRSPWGGDPHAGGCQDAGGGGVHCGFRYNRHPGVPGSLRTGGLWLVPDRHPHPGGGDGGDPHGPTAGQGDLHPPGASVRRRFRGLGIPPGEPPGGRALSRPSPFPGHLPPVILASHPSRLLRPDMGRRSLRITRTTKDSTMRRLAVLAVFALPGILSCQRGVPLEEAVASISEAEFLRKIEIIAHDSMLGRANPSPGLDMTAAWVADEFRRYGLKPGGDGGPSSRSTPCESWRRTMTAPPPRWWEAGRWNSGRT
jgi:hypothetical protein